MLKSLKRALVRLYSIFKMFGFDAIAFVNGIRGLGFYFRDLSRLKRQKNGDRSFPLGAPLPILGERFEKSGIMSGHYFHQDLFVARRIFANNPVRHIDIGSSTDSFVAHVASFRSIEIIDIRDQPSKVTNIHFRRADLMELPEDLIDACDSISCLHAIEHFGLGRYGDPIDYDGYAKGIANITKILKQGGKFYFSTPIGPQRIEFNAHRVFSVAFLVQLLSADYVIQGFSMVDDKGDFHENVELTPAGMADSFGCQYGCGIFELLKK